MLFGVYSLVMIWTFINIKLFLWDQKRYTNFPVLVFYICAVTIMTARMVPYFNALTMYADLFENDSLFWSRPYLYNFGYIVALFVKVIMGFF